MTLQCIAIGVPPPRIEWIDSTGSSFDTADELDFNERIFISKNFDVEPPDEVPIVASFIIIHKTLISDNDTRYTCQATNDVTMDEKIVHLIIQG